MGGTKGFRVDPNKLLDVAQQVDNLHSLVAEGNTAGNLPNFQQDGGPEPLLKALSVFWAGGGEDPLAKAYQTEHQAIVETYQAMATQLQNLAQSCRSTAQTYQNQDQASKQQVNASGSHETGTSHESMW